MRYERMQRDFMDAHIYSLVEQFHSYNHSVPYSEKLGMLNYIITRIIFLTIPRLPDGSPHVATLINADLTAFVKILFSQGMRTRWKPAVEPASWRLSKEMGWDQVRK